MRMSRKMMMNNIIKKFGFEDNVTIAFCTFAENPNTPQNKVEEIYKRLMQQ